MKTLKITVLLLAISITVACKNNKAEKEIDNAMEEVEAAAEEVKNEMKKEAENVIEEVDEMLNGLTINLESKSDSGVTGVVDFVEHMGKVTMRADLKGLSEGTHAIHIHEKADCSADDGTSAGGHWNPTAQPHGKWGDAAGFHKGDIGNMQAAADGTASIKMTTDLWCIGCGDPNKDLLGKSVIVHQGTDDFVSQPSGAAGARVSCAGIIE